MIENTKTVLLNLYHNVKYDYHMVFEVSLLEFIRTELDNWIDSPEIYPRWVKGNGWSNELVVLFVAHIIDILNSYSETMDTISLSLEDVKFLERLVETPRSKRPQTYEELIQCVEGFNTEAAEYLRTDARNLKDFVEFGDLSRCFHWEDTPQGRRYWNNIYTQVFGIELGLGLELVEEEETND